MNLDVLPWLLRTNVVVRARRRTREGAGVPIRVFSLLVLAILYAVPAGAALYACGVWNRDAVDFAFTVGWLLPVLLGLALPATAALSLSLERDTGMLDVLLLTPYSRASLLLGLVGLRLRIWVNLLCWSLPAFVLTGPLLALGQTREETATFAWVPVDLLCLGALGGAGWWLGVLLLAAYATMIGAWAAVEFRSAIGSVVMSYAMLFCLPMGLSYLGCSISAVIAVFDVHGRSPLLPLLWLVLLAGNLALPVLLVRSALRRLEEAGTGGAR